MIEILPVIVFVCAVWAFGNGILHDIFVIRGHTGGYDRELLRLLMDGHILLTCGAVYAIAFFLLKEENSAGLYLCTLAATSMIVYCLMIYPFLKSIVTLVMNVAALILSLIATVRL